MNTWKNVQINLRKAACPAHVNAESWKQFKLWAAQAWKAHLNGQAWQYTLRVPSKEAYALLLTDEGQCIVTDLTCLNIDRNPANRLWAKEVYRQARQLQRRGHYAEAIAQWELHALLIRDPYTSFFEIARCYLALANKRLALDYLAKAIATDPSRPEAYWQRARVYTRIGWYAKALKDVRVAHGFAQDPVMSLVLQAWIHASRGARNLAAESLRDALVHAPNDARLWQQLLILQVRLGNYKDAWTTWGHWNQLEPRSAALRYYKSLLLTTQPLGLAA